VNAEKLTKIKRLISRLDYKEVCEIRRHVDKRSKIEWRKDSVAAQANYDAEIKALPIGAKVLYFDARFDLAGCVGTIVRHLGSGSPRSAVNFGEDVGTWHVSRKRIEVYTTPERQKMVMQNAKLSGVLSRALNKMMANEGKKT